MDKLLKDSTLFQAVLAAISHGCVVHSLNGTVNSLEDILFHALQAMQVGRRHVPGLATARPCC